MVISSRAAGYRIAYHHHGAEKSPSIGAFRFLPCYLNFSLHSLVVIALAADHDEIQKQWQFLEKNVLLLLDAFDSEADARKFVLSKVEGLIRVEEENANATPLVCAPSEVSVELTTAESRRNALTNKFHSLFDVPEGEKLVNCMFEAAKLIIAPFS